MLTSSTLFFFGPDEHDISGSLERQYGYVVLEDCYVHAATLSRAHLYMGDFSGINELTIHNGEIFFTGNACTINRLVGDECVIHIRRNSSHYCDWIKFVGFCRVGKIIVIKDID